jgi:hypothetical protein
MKTCRHCGSAEPDNVYRCTVCERSLPFKWPSQMARRKAALTVVIPIVVWMIMTRLIGV